MLTTAVAACIAHLTVLQGEPSPPRTTRIFVARIPPSVTEAQFKQVRAAVASGLGLVAARPAARC